MACFYTRCHQGKGHVVLLLLMIGSSLIKIKEFSTITVIRRKVSIVVSECVFVCFSV